MAAHFSILACESHGQRSLVRYSPWGHKELGTSKETWHALALGLAFLFWTKKGWPLCTSRSHGCVTITTLASWH